MKIVGTVPEMQRLADELHRQGKRIGVVPTMGYLHDGHLSLIKVAREHAHVVITTIFVNPTQFGPNEDFGKYPRDLERDTKHANDAGTDILFVPTTDEMYRKDHTTYVNVDTLTEVLEGKARPSHFRGVTTIVTKLFNITKPHVAVFGQKDAQQAIVIERMIQDLNFDIRIIVSPIIRETDGLAMSSRNVYLSPQERIESRVISQSLRLAEKLVADGERKCSSIISDMTKLITSTSSARIDYLSIADAGSLQEYSALQPGVRVLISLAARFGTTRLIDNTIITI